MSVYVGIGYDRSAGFGCCYASLKPSIAAHAHQEARLHLEDRVGIANGCLHQRLG